MTLIEAQAGYDEVRRLAIDGDFEAAHDKEDQFREDVLRALEEGLELYVVRTKLRDLARIALSTSEIEFERLGA